MKIQGKNFGKTYFENFLKYYSVSKKVKKFKVIIIIIIIIIINSLIILLIKKILNYIQIIT